MNNNQIWYRDNANTDNYVYDYFYNETTKALWLKADNSDTLSFDYDPSLLPETDSEGPGGDVNSSARMVIRGGSWEYGAAELRNSNRSSCKSGLGIGRVSTGIGLRIVKINP